MSSNREPIESPTSSLPSRRPLPPGYIGSVFFWTSDVTSANPFASIDPFDIVGKTMRRARLSVSHPAATFDFTDGTTFQILVDGYDPAHPGVPKQLEMDPDLHALLTCKELLEITIIGCVLIDLHDKAFEQKPGPDGEEFRWGQQHRAIALKFGEEKPRWHCVWTITEDRDSEGICTFRNFSDLYLKQLTRTRGKKPDQTEHKTHLHPRGTWC